MVKVLIGNLLESKAQTLVNTVNCVGVMGKGIALAFKERYPAMFKDYVERCKRGEVKLGQPYLYKSLVLPWILNFPTKGHWRAVTRLEDITSGLEYLFEHYDDWGVTSLAVPPLGCGNGQLEWRVVGPTLYRYLRRMDIPVELYAPYGTPHQELIPEFLSGLETFPDDQGPRWIMPGWIGLVEIVKRLGEQPHSWPVGRVTFQKLAYVATEEGLPTGLLFRQGDYGPFAPEVKAMETRLVNNGLVIERPLGRMLALTPGPTYSDARRVYIDDLNRWQPIISRVTDLFMRMNTKQAELVATILFSARHVARAEKGLLSERDVLDAVMKWKPRLDKGEVAATIRNLAALGWLAVQASKDLPLPRSELIHV